MKIHGWGRYPIIDAEVSSPLTKPDWIVGVKENSFIARGLGRSYGDAANGKRVFQTTHLNHYIAFDNINGTLTCEAGISIHEILHLIVPKGWFMPVTPGTSYVTVGGAIASDVHGKNHHLSGTFTQHVQYLDLLLGTGDIVTISKHHLPELFYATCGGMGLTGVILSANFKLTAIRSSDIQQTTVKASCLEKVVEQFEVNHSNTYSVAWVDCLAKGNQLGRSLLTLGEHASEGPLAVSTKKPISVPLVMPTQLLNYYSIKTFNTLYYAKQIKQTSKKNIPLESFFYPLDKLGNWNRLYGRQGFVQYQFVLPKNTGVIALRDILKRISHSGKGSFLAVLKAFGAGNQNLLSFPIEGFTLALDFKAEASVFKLIQQLDSVVLAYGGKVYLTKDALMTEAMFKASYPRWQEFEEVRAKYGAVGQFVSSQSKRLGLQ